jgi:ribosomal protein L22
MFNQYLRSKKHVEAFFNIEKLKIEDAIKECNEFSEAMRAFAFIEFRHYNRKSLIITYDKYITFVEENEQWIKEEYLKWLNSRKENAQQN